MVTAKDREALRAQAELELVEIPPGAGSKLDRVVHLFSARLRAAAEAIEADEPPIPPEQLARLAMIIQPSLREIK